VFSTPGSRRRDASFPEAARWDGIFSGPNRNTHAAWTIGLSVFEPGVLVDGDPLPAPDRDTVPSGGLERLYRTHRARLQRYLTRRTTHDHAQDLVQQTFLRLASLSESKVTQLSKPEMYLRSVATNLACDEARAAQRQSRHLHSSDVIEWEGNDPVGALEARDMLNRLETAMMGLKPQTRAIFLAHRLEGLSYSDIAVRTGLSVKGVEKQMSKAIAHLDRFLSRSR
jgi:RNA polymerase sigma-70 factor (ECF subfamily)